MSVTIRLDPALLHELGEIAARENRDVSEQVADVLRQFVRSRRETAHLTSIRANVRRLRSAHAEIETEIARCKRKASQEGRQATFTRIKNGLLNGSR